MDYATFQFLQSVSDRLGFLLGKVDDIVSKIAEFADKMAAHNAKVDAAITGLQGDVSGLKDQIAALQASQGTVTPEDQALLDGIESRAGTIAASLSALDDLTPPVPPAA